MHRDGEPSLFVYRRNRVLRRHRGAHELVQEQAHDMAVAAAHLLPDYHLQRGAATLEVAPRLKSPLYAVVIGDSDGIQPRNPRGHVHNLPRRMPAIRERGVNMRITQTHAGSL